MMRDKSHAFFVCFELFWIEKYFPERETYCPRYVIPTERSEWRNLTGWKAAEWADPWTLLGMTAFVFFDRLPPEQEISIEKSFGGNNMKLPFIEAGEIVTTHGVRGEVKLLTWLDSPEDLLGFERCRIAGKEYAVESVRVQKSCNLVKLAGIDTMEQAQTFRGKTLELYREDIDEEVIFAAELTGMEVYAGGALLGKITEVLDYPGNKVYVVQGEHEYLIPAVKEFILSTDLEKNEMTVKLLEGMRSDEN